MARRSRRSLARPLRPMMQGARAPLVLGALTLIAAGVWAALISAPHLSARASGLDRLEAALLDLRLSVFGPVDPATEVAIVAIDDATLAANQGAPGANRALLARTIDAIAAAGATTVGLDVVLADPGDAAVDARLAEALSQIPSVIAAAASFSAGSQDVGVARPASILRPQPVFADVAQAALVNISTDATGTPRYVPSVFATETGIELSFALALASRLRGVEPQIAADALNLGGDLVPLDVGLTMPLRLIGPEGHIPTYSASVILDGTHAADLAGKAVLVGFTATAFGDRFPGPYGESVPGVEIMAGAVSQMLGSQPLRRDLQTRRIDTAASVVLALLASGLVLLLPLSSGVPAALALVAAWGAAILAAFSAGVWLSAAVPLVSAMAPVAAAAALRYYTEKRRASRGAAALEALKKFQSPLLAEMIAEDPDFLKQPTSRALSILFIDLSGFTLLSERLGPAGTQDLLKNFHQITAAGVEGQGGVVLNYMGDGALAVFGMTDDGEASADQAFRTSFALLDDLAALGEGRFTVGCRIGLHHGEVVLSRLGGDHHQQVSVAGDSVNLTSRLLEIAKAEGAAIAATDSVLQRARQSPLRPADRTKTVEVRGRDGGAEVHFWMG
ncbi:CHASE2 domain-containing protein [Roseobacter sinensis]|uniref:Adenylate/guanylate cyclase domain-containing protein n=1 Tax=Roseobacter sinensis TaxID=2931391 RepID=A0ABT3BB23_9RHOB|nr:adenylate/guanylate cyclase domain-containing protein [Roseobacter sp. WL0113]MCV3270768.1 adenylate/guanylate cyclase domain-containing protein [Roseobacter sp. WL0113]